MQGLHNRSFAGWSVAIGLGLALQALPALAQGRITSPKQQFGFNIGDDYRLANYTQFEAYWRKLAKESSRMKLVEIGKTAEGRTQLMSIISSPANIARLDHYKEISRKLAFAEGLTDDEAHALAREGKAVVWIDGGLHATEVLGAAQLIETVFEGDVQRMRFSLGNRRGLGQEVLVTRPSGATLPRNKDMCLAWQPHHAFAFRAESA